MLTKKLQDRQCDIASNDGFLVKVRSRCLLASHGEMTPTVGGHLRLISAKIEQSPRYLLQ